MENFHPISLYLENTGAILSGVFAKHGCWYASYTWIHGKQHLEKVKKGLLLLENHPSPTIAFENNKELLRILVDSLV